MLQKQVLLAIGNTLALFCKLLCLSPTSAAYNRHPELGVWQTFWVVKRARGGPGRGGGGGGAGWEMACPLRVTVQRGLPGMPGNRLAPAPLPSVELNNQLE